MIRRRDYGFTAVELLITLFVAAAFLIAGYQLYFVVLKDNGGTQAQAKAANVAYNYLRQYGATLSAPCSPATPVIASPLSVSGLTNVTVTVSITCPYSSSSGANDTTNVSRVDVVVNYNNPTQTVEYTSYGRDIPNTNNSTDITNGLVGWWKFNGDANAAVGTGATVLNGAPLTTGQNGRANSAYSFNGSNQDMTISSSFSLTTTNVTMSTWVNNPTATNSGAFFKIGDNGYGIGIGNTSFDNSNPGTKLIALYEGVRWIVTSKDLGTGWHHVALVVDASGVPSVYEDGVLIGQYAGANALAPASNSGSYIAAGSATGRMFKGSIDDVRVYNRPLSATEVQTLYTNGAQ